MISLPQLARSVNLRDLGGIATASGREVRRGVLYRCGSLGQLTADDRAGVIALGIHSIIDLRHNSERAADPTPWADLGCRSYWSLEHEPSVSGDLGRLLLDGTMTGEAAQKLMIGVYQQLPFQNIQALRQLFQTAIRAEGPILFHCTSGKDRTGIAAALVLTAIGVPRAAVNADYLATVNFDILASRAYRDLAPERREALAPIYGVNQAYLDAAFEAIEAREGSVHNFLRRALELTDEELRRLSAAVLA